MANSGLSTPAVQAADSSRGGGARPWPVIRVRAAFLPTLSIAIASAALYAYFATGGTLRFDRGMRYYDELGVAFARGQLYLAAQPRPELLALSNPYDATLNRGLT